MDKKKELKRQYQQNHTTMGVYQIRNVANDKVLIGSALNLPGAINSSKFHLSGLKEARFLRNYEPGSEEHARLSLRLSRPSLADAFYAMLRRHGFDLPDVPVEEGRAKDAAQQKRIGELKRIYQDADKHYPLFLLAESLIEYDEMFSMWRLHHIKMVERMIGSKTGTGGSEGAAYLKTTVERKFFPELWELRSYLGLRTEEGLRTED